MGDKYVFLNISIAEGFDKEYALEGAMWHSYS